MKTIFTVLSVGLSATEVSASSFEGFYLSAGPIAESGTFSFGVEYEGHSAEITSFDMSGEALEFCGSYLTELGQSAVTVGIEFCGYSGAVSGSRTYQTSVGEDIAQLRFYAESEQEYAIRGRVGYIPHPAWLLELQGGLMAAEFEYGIEASYADFSASWDDDGWAMGATIGFQVSYAINDWSAISGGVDWIWYEGEDEKDLFDRSITTVASQDTVQLSVTYSLHI